MQEIGAAHSSVTSAYAWRRVKTSSDRSLPTNDADATWKSRAFHFVLQIVGGYLTPMFFLTHVIL